MKKMKLNNIICQIRLNSNIVSTHFGYFLSIGYSIVFSWKVNLFCSSTKITV